MIVIVTKGGIREIVPRGNPSGTNKMRGLIKRDRAEEAEKNVAGPRRYRIEKSLNFDGENMHEFTRSGFFRHEFDDAGSQRE